MTEEKCKHENCTRNAISNSRYCGQHTNNRKFNATLKSLKGEELNGIVWNEVEIRKITFRGNAFSAPLISNTDFTNVTFKKCDFTRATFEHIVFTDCKFIGCTFLQPDFTDVTFHETIFEDSHFEDSRFSEINFADGSLLANCFLDGCSFNGGLFSETGMSTGTRFLNNTFTQTSLSQANFTNCQFIETAFSKTSFYDSVFRECYFNTISHDFKLSGVPVLCDFRGSELINMGISQNFRKWNNLKKEPVPFYLDVIDWLLNVDHPNYLSELALALKHIIALDFKSDQALNGRIQQLFKYLAADAAQTGNYNMLGEILSAFGRIPESFRMNTSFFLPPADPESGAYSQARLTITTEMGAWSLAKVSRIIQLLGDLEEQLPPDRPQIIQYIEQGSFIIQVLGGLKQLLAGFQSLVDFKKTRWEVKIKELEYRKLEIELEHFEKAKKLEREKAELDIYDKKLDILKKLQEQTGFDYAAYLKTPKGKKAAGIGEVIKKEYPILQLKLED